ncbi:hypothetical protein N7499_013335 [Penicillium canescens]|uniref:Uncharacterized protein n=1 Tax=Penicillium canescens TaxID=5083 RepID=A0AAD6I6E3_PENCN|nr:uncharacterized protein N7446_000016 [Penicillium canescens]KAJ6011691.1 hypothetical protein N7522_002046 [Penicillium canescens]KAJ6030918.1 hypothetical protein N7460_011184 [Penicillium canescens]KAJ6064655.1 hypothetical protein N7499_013335 [Penicillium canescens]KAJ6077080.1 hypothetical protein N7446_000016 [Penicillium canescens]KAJ6153847.1 hypothetical protein N7485_012216 [Penicillium canescens]
MRRHRAKTLEVGMVFHDGKFESNDPACWFCHYKNCVQHFLDHGQYMPMVQSIAAFVVTCLPYQRCSDPIATTPTLHFNTLPPFVSLRQYIKCLFVTAETPRNLLRAFFGDLWEAGIPFLTPLCDSSEDEIRAPEVKWIEWLAIEY